MRFHKKNSRSLLASLLIHALWATFAHHKDVPTKSGQWVGRYNKNIGPPHDLPPLRSFVLSSIFRPSPHQSDQRIYDAPRRPVAPLSSNSRKAILRKFTDCSSPMIFVIRRFHLSERERRIGRDLTFNFISRSRMRKMEENGGRKLLFTFRIVLRKQERPVIDFNRERCNDAVLSPVSRRTIGRPRPTSSARFY